MKLLRALAWQLQTAGAAMMADGLMVFGPSPGERSHVSQAERGFLLNGVRLREKAGKTTTWTTLTLLAGECMADSAESGAGGEHGWIDRMAPKHGNWATAQAIR